MSKLAYTSAYISSYFYIIFSSFYLSSIIFSPIYILTFIGFSCFLIYIAFKNRFVGDFPSFIVVSLICTVGISQYMIDGLPNVILGFVFSLQCYLILLNTLNNLSKKHIFKLLQKMFRFSTVIFLTDTLVRYLYPIIKPKDQWFYQYKYNSIMYLDSNFVGLNILILLCLYQCLRMKFGYKKQKITYYTLVILLILTISRASIITYILVLIVLHIKKRYWLLGIPIIIPFIWYKVKNDGSFISKFDLWQRFYKFLSNASFNELLFGVGLGNAKNALGMGAHNIIITYAVETGMIVLLLIFILWTAIHMKSKGNSSYILLPLLINGFSLTTTNIPYVYMATIIIMILTNKINYERKISICNNASI